MNEQKAKEAIKEIGGWLKDGAEGATSDCVYESIPIDLSRKYALMLLLDAKNNSRYKHEDMKDHNFDNIYEYYNAALGAVTVINFTNPSLKLIK